MTIVEIMLGVMATIFGGVSTFLIIANIKTARGHKLDVEKNKRDVMENRKALDATIATRRAGDADNAKAHKMLLRYNMALGKGMIKQGVNGAVKIALEQLEDEVLDLLK